MKGLNNKQFYELLRKREFSKIYVSYVSKMILMNDSASVHLSEFIEDIPVEKSTMIPVRNRDGQEEYYLTVTLLPAGHCPGSVMFFFEGPNGNVLYTGDFRIEVGGAQRLCCVHYENGLLKPISRLYLDTTFCDKKSLFFPTREQSMDAIISLIKPWIDKGPDHVIYFECPAQYGYETVFVYLYEKLKLKTHIQEQKFRKFQNVPEILESVTTDSKATQIHACYYKEFRDITLVRGETPCNYYTSDGKPVKVRQIKPCAWSFAMNINLDDIISSSPLFDMYRVCYPTHSSLTELWDIVNYLQPQAISANVVPQKEIEENILSLLTPLIKNDISSPMSEFRAPLLGEFKATDLSSSDPSSGSFDFYKVTCPQNIGSGKINVVKATNDGEPSFSPTVSTIDISSGLGSQTSVESCSPQKTEVDSSSEIEFSSQELQDCNFEDCVNQEPTSNSRIIEDKSPNSPLTWHYSPPSSPAHINNTHTNLDITRKSPIQNPVIEKRSSNIPSCTSADIKKILPSNHTCLPKVLNNSANSLLLSSKLSGDHKNKLVKNPDKIKNHQNIHEVSQPLIDHSSWTSSLTTGSSVKKTTCPVMCSAESNLQCLICLIESDSNLNDSDVMPEVNVETHHDITRNAVIKNPVTEKRTSNISSLSLSKAANVEKVLPSNHVCLSKVLHDSANSLIANSKPSGDHENKPFRSPHEIENHQNVHEVSQSLTNNSSWTSSFTTDSYVQKITCPVMCSAKSNLQCLVCLIENDSNVSDSDMTPEMNVETNHDITGNAVMRNPITEKQTSNISSLSLPKAADFEKVLPQNHLCHPKVLNESTNALLLKAKSSGNHENKLVGSSHEIENHQNIHEFSQSLIDNNSWTSATASSVLKTTCPVMSSAESHLQNLICLIESDSDPNGSDVIPEDNLEIPDKKSNELDIVESSNNNSANVIIGNVSEVRNRSISPSLMEPHRDTFLCYSQCLITEEANVVTSVSKKQKMSNPHVIQSKSSFLGINRDFSVVNNNDDKRVIYLSSDSETEIGPSPESTPEKASSFLYKKSKTVKNSSYQNDSLQPRGQYLKNNQCHSRTSINQSSYADCEMLMPIKHNESVIAIDNE